MHPGTEDETRALPTCPWCALGLPCSHSCCFPLASHCHLVSQVRIFLCFCQQSGSAIQADQLSPQHTVSDSLDGSWSLMGPSTVGLGRGRSPTRPLVQSFRLHTARLARRLEQGAEISLNVPTKLHLGERGVFSEAPTGLHEWYISQSLVFIYLQKTPSSRLCSASQPGHLPFHYVLFAFQEASSSPTECCGLRGPEGISRDLSSETAEAFQKKRGRATGSKWTTWRNQSWAGCKNNDPGHKVDSEWP